MRHVQSLENITLTGQALVDALIARDDLTWRAFLHELGPMLMGICRKDELDADQVDDIAQAVVEKLLDRDCRILRELKVVDNKSFFAWLRIVISRTAIDYVRAARIRRDRETKCARAILDESSVVISETERIELRVIMENAASGLTPLDQTILWLKYREVSDTEMARITGLSLAALEKRLSRLKQKVREVLKGRGVVME